MLGNLLRRRPARAGARRDAGADTEHLRHFAETRPGVEAFFEPQTSVTEPTVVLVAATGEWTRRRVASRRAAESLARKHTLPLYDAALVGYPQRMRTWNARRKEAGDLGMPGPLG